jgi:putative ATP-binding cassette transporter
VEIIAGERVLIVGEPGAGKTLLFRALAGLWPWGAGRVTRPTGEELWYMARTPYLPSGTLGEVLAYPLKVESFTERAFTDALQLLGLRRLVPLLAKSGRWDRELSDDEQQSLAFARVVLHAPPWVLIDEVLDSLDDEIRERVINIFATDLKQTGVIHIGRGRARDPVFTRVLHLIKDPTVRRLARRGASAPSAKRAQRSAADG